MFLKQKKILVFGTFDILHPGHIYFLKQAKKYGNYLIVVIARDQTVKQIKKEFPQNNEKARLKKIKQLNFVDQIILGNHLGIKNKFDIISKINPYIICLGYDQKVKNLSEELKKRKIICKIIQLLAFYPEKYKSSLLKNKSVLN